MKYISDERLKLDAVSNHIYRNYYNAVATQNSVAPQNYGAFTEALGQIAASRPPTAVSNVQISGVAFENCGPIVQLKQGNSEAQALAPLQPGYKALVREVEQLQDLIDELDSAA